MNRKISCLIIDDEKMAREILETHLSKIENVQVIASCNSVSEAFKYLSNHTIDFILLDINMPEISGIYFAKSINKEVKIIFTTAYRDYAVEGFELKAVDYLLKPITYERLLQAVNTYFEVYVPSKTEHIKEKDQNEFMFIRSERKMIKIDFVAINYIESYSDYIKINLDDKVITTRETISAIEAKLPSNLFLRIHRSYIISISHISSFTNEHINIKNNSLPISRSYKKDVLKLLDQF